MICLTPLAYREVEEEIVHCGGAIIRSQVWRGSTPKRERSFSKRERAPTWALVLSFGAGVVSGILAVLFGGWALGQVK
jgi:hypothetical protein